MKPIGCPTTRRSCCALKRCWSTYIHGTESDVAQYPFPVATAYQKEVEAADAANAKPKPKPVVSENAVVVSEPDQDMDTVAIAGPAPAEPAPPPPSTDEIVEKRTGDAVAPADAPDVPTRFAEKKRLDWAEKTCTSIE